MKKCSRCNKTKRVGLFHKQLKAWDGLRPACISCEKASPLSEINRVACRKRYKKTGNGHGAHVIVNKALQDGTLIKQSCNSCGSAKSEAHHEDYTRPLDVVWLCRSHHLKRHAELRSLGIDLHKNYKEAMK